MECQHLSLTCIVLRGDIWLCFLTINLSGEGLCTDFAFQVSLAGFLVELYCDGLFVIAEETLELCIKDDFLRR